MAGAKETPRQKMIGMMYLVLTAMLALNVSKDILDAFVVVNEGMVSSNESVAAKIAGQYYKFETQYDSDKNKVQEYWEKAQELRLKTSEMTEYIENIKRELVAEAEKVDVDQVYELYGRPIEIEDQFTYETRTRYEIDLMKIPSKDNYDVPTNYMLGNETRGPGKSVELVQKMNDFRSYIISIVGEENAGKVGLKTDGEYRNASGQKQTWAEYNFFHTVLAASVTILNKIISEIQTAEFDALNVLYNSISEGDFKFDNIMARVIPKSTYVLQGQTYEAEIIVSAFESKRQFEARWLNGTDKITDANIKNARVIKSKDGVVKLDFVCTGQGPQRYAGVIEMMDPITGEMKNYHFSNEFTVAPPALTVAPTKMNVFYAGIKNPISISAPGIPIDKIVPSISKGKLARGANGEWEVEVNLNDKETQISATAMIDGKNVHLGSVPFRIKRTPDPVATVAGVNGGEVEKGLLEVQQGVIAQLKDFDFEGVRYSVTSYIFVSTTGQTSTVPRLINSGAFTEDVKNAISRSRSGTKLYFENIKAKGPDGTTRDLGTIVLTVK